MIWRGRAVRPEGGSGAGGDVDGRQPQKHGKPLLISSQARNPPPQPAPPNTSFPDEYRQTRRPRQVLFTVWRVDTLFLTAKPQFSAGFRCRDKRDKRDNTIVLSLCPDVPASRRTVPMGKSSGGLGWATSDGGDEYSLQGRSFALGGVEELAKEGKKAGGSVCAPGKRLWGGKAANEEKMSLSPRG